MYDIAYDVELPYLGKFPYPEKFPHPGFIHELPHILRPDLPYPVKFAYTRNLLYPVKFPGYGKFSYPGKYPYPIIFPYPVKASILKSEYLFESNDSQLQKSSDPNYYYDIITPFMEWDLPKI